MSNCSWNDNEHVGKIFEENGGYSVAKFDYQRAHGILNPFGSNKLEFRCRLKKSARPYWLHSYSVHWRSLGIHPRVGSTETSQVFGVYIPGAGQLAPRSVMPNGASVDITTLFSGNLVGNGGGLVEEDSKQGWFSSSDDHDG